MQHVAIITYALHLVLRGGLIMQEPSWHSMHTRSEVPCSFVEASEHIVKREVASQENPNILRRCFVNVLVTSGCVL